MNITRRGLLGMFAAGAAAAVLPSGVAMRVRPSGIVVPDWAENPADTLADMLGHERRGTPELAKVAAMCEEEVSPTAAFGALQGLIVGDFVSINDKTFVVTSLSHNIAAAWGPITTQLQAHSLSPQQQEFARDHVARLDALNDLRTVEFISSKKRGSRIALRPNPGLSELAVEEKFILRRGS